MAKVDRKKLLKEPDEFLTLSDRAIRWAQANLRMVIGLGTAVVVVAAVVLGIKGYLNYRAGQAAEALAAAFGAYRQVVAGQADQNQRKQAIEGLSQVTQQYGATPAGMQARLALASLYLGQGQYDQAQANFQELADDPDTPAELMPLALRGLGQCREGLEKYSEAAEAYRQAARQAGPGLAAMLRLDEGRVLEAAGDGKAAQSAYGKVLAEAPESQAAKLARDRLVALGADPQAAQAAPVKQGP